MRIAFATWSDRRAGGVESYIEAVLPQLAGLGHEVALWHETWEPSARERTELPAGTPTQILRDPDQALALAESWRADAIFIQGLHSVALEAALLGRPTTAFVAHNYAGTCISGTRAWSVPVGRPCHREFGALCLAHYLPHGCGGLSPVTMVRQYRRELARQEILRASAIVTLSSHMREVFLQHGFDHQRVIHVPYGPAGAPVEPRASSHDGDAVRLMVVARLERLKGVHLLMDALVTVQRTCGRDVHLVVVGDGRASRQLQRQAARHTADNPRIHVSFVGWITPEDRDRRMLESDVLIMPSVWPEPLGIVGMEAARLGLPVVAFDVGGVRDWLIDGVNGRLVPGDPPTADALARVLCEWLAVAARTSVRATAQDDVHAPTPETHARGLIDVAQHLRARMCS